MVRLRTIQQTYDYLKAKDPETVISQSFIRTLVKNNKIPYILGGTGQEHSPVYINIDEVEKYINKALGAVLSDN